jgi:hypothetical protein
MSMFYASFREASKAQQVALALLTEGVQPDDISVVAHESTASQMGVGTIGLQTDEATEPLEDATAFVGRADDPDQDSVIPEARDSNSYIYQQESQVGAGIATSTPDDNASRYDEMDDIETAESEMIYAPSDRPHSRHEANDLQLTLETGFPTGVPVIDDFAQQRLPGEAAIAHGLDTITLPGFGVVMGGGPLATAALDMAKGENASGTEPLEGFLTEEGVPPRAAREIIEQVRQGGAVLAVALVPGEIDPTHVEELATRNGATEFGTYDAPRF